jgi:capsular exopolysaccharide synthesis family protein
MGRVDEAMRRAAEAARAGRPTADPASPVAPDLDPALVTSEEFPVELTNGHSPASEATVRSVIETPVPITDPAADAMLIAAAGDVPADVPAGLVDHMDGSLREKVVVDANMLPASREQYRRLAAALHHAQAASGVKVVMIASAVANEGKTLTAANLALTLSESYRRNVLLIDADLRRPSLHTFFKVRGAPGLNEGLTAADEPKLPLHDVSPRLTILPAGMPNSDPMAGLTSRRMQSLIDEAREAFAWVIIDTPPVGLLTDANLLASMVDGAVLVVKAGSTPYDLVKRAVDTIGPSKLLGVVLNQAHGTLGKYSYQYSDYYHRAPAPAKGGAR